MMRPTSQLVARASATVLLATVAGLAWILADGPAGPAYLLLYAGWLLPGLPLGWRLFGTTHPGGWIAGAVLGYPLSALGLSLAAAAGATSGWALGGGWLLMAAASWGAFGRRGRPPLVPLAAWTSRDVAALALLLLMVPALVGRPFARIGSEDEAGNHRYRAYFTADFLWHMALSAEIEKLERPLRNPYLASEPLHYYWLYFVPPAVTGVVTGGKPDREARLAINALGTALLLVAAVFLLAWCGIGRAGPAMLAVALAVLAASAEGLYALAGQISRGDPISALRDVNIDALTLWDFRAFTIDGLPRAMMYNPQHSLACAAGLVALAAVASAGAAMTVPAALLCGLALAVSLMLSPFPGGVLTLVFGISVALDLVRTGERRLQRAGVMLAGVVPIAGGLAWAVANGVLEGAGGDLNFGLHRRSTAAPLTALALAVGPLLVPTFVGILVAWRLPRGVRPGLVGIAVALALIFFVSLESADVWVGWRAGQILLVTAPVLAAHGFAALRAGRTRVAGTVLALLLFAAGLPTTVLDAINAQDVDNDRRGPGFRWVVSISRHERQALAWVGRQTEPDAIVQMEPTSRGRDTWTLVPSFAARRMSAGLPISLLDAPAYHAGSERVRALFSSSDPEAVWREARAMAIDYLYLGSVELSVFPHLEEVLTRRPDLFSGVFRNREARIFRVEPLPPPSSSSAPASPD